MIAFDIYRSTCEHGTGTTLSSDTAHVQHTALNPDCIWCPEHDMDACDICQAFGL